MAARFDRAGPASTQDEAAVAAEALAFVSSWVGKACRRCAAIRSAGPSFHGTASAGPGGILPLPQSRRVDAEGACRRWKPELAKGFVKKADHTAMADIRESIAELRYYREHFLKPERRFGKDFARCGQGVAVSRRGGRG